MNTFSSLLNYVQGRQPGEAQASARSDFPNRFCRSRLKLRKPDSRIPVTGDRFIIGVASYSPEELSLLDQLEKSLNNGTSGAIEVEVFDVLNCSNPKDFEKYIPGIDGVYRTPLIGVIHDGQLVARATGLEEVVETLRHYKVLNC